MREMLEPVFGESGAIIVQFLITLVVILLLIGVVYWLIRRFGGVRFNGAGRGRMPRLAIIDALPVDSRRKLVLIRRDNVEHLLLIGGTSDVVVEPSIPRAAAARPRPAQAPQQQAQHQPQQPQRMAPHAQAPQQPVAHQAPAAHPPAPPSRPESTGISEPIPFPPAQSLPPRQMPRPARRVAAVAASEAEAPEQPIPQRRAATRPVPVATEPMAVPAPAPRQFASAHFEEPSRPTRVDSAFAMAEARDNTPEPSPAPAVEEPEIPPARPAPVAAFVPPPAPEPAQREENSDEDPAEAPDLEMEPGTTVAMSESPSEAEEAPGEEHERATKVSDLEREMARLLGEITSRRES